MIEKGFHQLLVLPDKGENATPLGVVSKRHVVELMSE
jgi:hypothetical protein